MRKPILSRKGRSFTESVIREMTRGAYYVMANIDGLSPRSDRELTEYLVRDVGVAVIPGSSFFHRPGERARYVRFCFCKREPTLKAAVERLRKISPRN